MRLPSTPASSPDVQGLRVHLVEARAVTGGPRERRG
jgi:hypothetical protein